MDIFTGIIDALFNETLDEMHRNMYIFIKWYIQNDRKLQTPVFSIDYWRQNISDKEALSYGQERGEYMRNYLKNLEEAIKRQIQQGFRIVRIDMIKQ